MGSLFPKEIVYDEVLFAFIAEEVTYPSTNTLDFGLINA
jgi:hypothetical protein